MMKKIEIDKAYRNLTIKRGRPEYAPTTKELQIEIIKQIVHDYYATEDSTSPRVLYKKLAKKYGCKPSDIRDVISSETAKPTDDEEDEKD